MGLRILHLHLHGLIRSHDLELGRDADNGGQTLYVLELVKSLAARPEVDEVQVATRMVHDRRVSSDYSVAEESIAPGASILRFPFGPRRYLRKEQLWPFLDDLADQLVTELQQQQKSFDWIHAHYADAGYVGALISRRLGIPLVFTGHSLGREKQRRLLATGANREQIEQTYALSRRIDAEELALAHSSLVITSTKQEADHQYSRYGSFVAEKAEVVPPGVDSTRFHPLQSAEESDQVDALLQPFLRDLHRPPLLAISRADRRKNVPALIEAFGRSPVLRQRHNLVLVLGCREDSRQLEKQQREVFQQVFDLIDRFDLYGQVAYPKQHRRDQIPAIYRWAANHQGLFVNPALTEPFGLTLLESAASGLPVVATDDGGPRDILARCENGLLTDVTDLEALQDVLEGAGSSPEQWRRWSDNGIEAISRHFSWDAHVCRYLALMQSRMKLQEPRQWLKESDRLEHPEPDRLLLLDLDSNLEQPEGEALADLRSRLSRTGVGHSHALGIITGRSVKAARQRYAELHFPDPQVWISRAGSEIYYGNHDKSDQIWESCIGMDWQRPQVEAALEDLLREHLTLQDQAHQGHYKISYLLRQPGEAILPLVRQRLRHRGQAARPHLRCHWFLDVLPLRASRSEAIRHLALRWSLPLEKVVVVASQQGDAELMRGLPAAVVPAEHDPCLESLRHQQRVFFASKSDVRGVLEGLNHYRFLSSR